MPIFDDWADIYDRVHAYLTEDIPFYVEQAVASGGPVLELGCGTGRVSVPIAQTGVPIVGVDISPRLIGVAKSKAQAAGVSHRCAFHVGDMREVNLQRRFPLVIMPFRPFQSMLSVADQRAALERIRLHLAPQGRLVFDVWTPEAHILADEAATPAHFRDVPDPATGHTLCLWLNNSWDHLHQINSVRLIIDEVDGEGVVVRRLHRDFQVRYTFHYEMQHLLSACGFRVAELYGGFQRQELDEDSEDMVWVVETA